VTSQYDVMHDCDLMEYDCDTLSHTMSHSVTCDT